MGVKGSKIIVQDKVVTCYNPACQKELTLGDVILDKDEDLICEYCGAYTGIRFESIPKEYIERMHQQNSSIKKRNSIKGLPIDVYYEGRMKRDYCPGHI